MSDHAWTVHRSGKRVGGWVGGGGPASGQCSFFHHRLYTSEKQGPSLEHASSLRILVVSVLFRPHSLSSSPASSSGTCTAPPRPSPSLSPCTCSCSCRVKERQNRGGLWSSWLECLPGSSCLQESKRRAGHRIVEHRKRAPWDSSLLNQYQYESPSLRMFPTPLSMLVY
jgi:hypothetical protein